MLLDSAIVKALSLDLQVSHVSTHGHSGFTSSAKITTTIKDVLRQFFVKTGAEGDMFSSEHESLNAIHAAVPSLCPASLAHGKLADSSGYFLVTDFLDMSARDGGEGSGMSFAKKLAKLHMTPAPTPQGFGFAVTTFCGSTPQKNDYKSSWAEFYAENRLRAIGRAIKENHGPDSSFATLLQKTADQVVPKLLGNGHLGGEHGIVPVLVHGDLWSGNKSRGTIGGKGGIEDVIFDPSSCYAHSEYELGIMRMFGGFSKSFFTEYHGLVPKTEPEDEYEDRMELYELYHYLNHYAIFGGGYKQSAVGIMKKLCQKHGVR